MNRLDFIKYLQKPYTIEPESVKQLEEVVKDYPFCQAGQVLYAYSLYKLNTDSYTSRLRIAAAYASSRKRLKMLFNQFMIPEKSKTIINEQSKGDAEAYHDADIIHTKEEIIAKFIREEPRISRSMSEFYNPSESAIRSSQDEDDIVSETLAWLYSNQGNNAKAIRIFQKLSLLFPEKSSYFAAQIEKLKLKN